LTEDDQAPFDYVLGCRMHRQKEVSEAVLARAGRYQHVAANLEVKVSWPDLMRDLGQVHAVLLELDGKRYQLRTDMIGSAHHAFAAAGVRPPSPVTPLGAIP
jgi:hypothetical protein